MFSQVLADDVEQLRPLRRDVDYGLIVGSSEYIAGIGIMDWLSRKLNEIGRMADAITQLLNVALADAMRPEGIPAEPEEIVYVAQRMAQVYKSAIEWTLELNRVHCDSEFKRAVSLMSEFGRSMLEQIEGYGRSNLEKIEQAVNAPRVPGERQVVELKLTLTSPDLTEFNREMNRLRRLYSVR